MGTPDFTARSTATELMDTHAATQPEFSACLRDLERINVCTMAYRPTLGWLESMLAGSGGMPVTILDAGSGGGDMLRRIWRLAEKRGWRVELTGADINPFARHEAERRTPDGAPIRYETADIFSLEPERRYDFIINSLFTHHLNDHALLRFVRWMDDHARRGWFINDLHRHPLPYHFIRHATRFTRRHHMVRHDAPVSVARAFTAAEWYDVLARLDLPEDQTDVSWHFPFRYGVSCRKP